MLKRDILATFSANVFGTMMSLGSFVILNRILQPEGRGLLNLALLIPQTTAIFCVFGQVTVNSTYAGLYKEKRIQLFQQSILIAIFTAVISCLILFAFFFWLPIPQGEFVKLDPETIYLICFIAPAMTFSMIIVSLVRGVGRITSAAKIQAFQAITSVALLAIFLLGFKKGVKTAIIILIAEYVFAILMSFWVLRDYISLHPSHFSSSFLKKSLSFGLKISLATLAGHLIYRLDQGILAYMVSEYQIGLYAVAVSLAEKLKLLPRSISGAFLPRLANELEARQSQVPMVFRYTTIVSVVSMILIGIVGIPIILVLCGWSFAGSIPAFLLLLPGIATLGGSGILASDLIARNKPKYSIWTGWSILVINVVLNFAWIPLLGIAGAALASSVAYTLAGVLWMIFYLKESKMVFREMIPRPADVKFLWQQSIMVAQQIRTRLSSNKNKVAAETEDV
jgi:O-antigen/teichoic acid export membrane protein